MLLSEWELGRRACWRAGERTLMPMQPRLEVWVVTPESHRTGAAERWVRAAAGSSSSIVHVPYDEAYAAGFEDMQRRVPDVRKLEHAIGYRLNTPLERIIGDVVAEQRAMLAAT